MDVGEVTEELAPPDSRLAVLSPLLGKSATNFGYDSLPQSAEPNDSNDNAQLV